MSNPTKIGAAGSALVREFEGFPNNGRPYWDRPASDPRRVLTIGYGTTRINGRPIRSTDHLTHDEAIKLFLTQINGTYARALTEVLNNIGIKVNQNQYDALLSIVYNCGPGILARGRSLGDALRSPNWVRETPGAIYVYHEPNNPNVREGLLRRRRAEIALFKSKKGLKDDTVRKIKLGDKEEFHVERLRAKRRSRNRHDGWKNIGKIHNDEAVESAAWLRARANHLLKSDEIKDADYRNRKVKFLRDVALNRNGLGV